MVMTGSKKKKRPLSKWNLTGKKTKPGNNTVMQKKFTQQSEIKDWYISNFRQFEKRLNGNGKGFFGDIRKEALDYFREVGFPQPRSEDWKYTSIKPILDQRFPLREETPDREISNLDDFLFEDLDSHLMVFLNGHFLRDLSDPHTGSNGIIIENLETAYLNHHSLLEKYLTHYAEYRQDSFTALNTAFSEDGLFLYIPDHQILEKPVHLLNLSDPRNTYFQSHPRNLVILRDNSECSLIETHYHLSDGTYFHNAVSEIIIGKASRFNYSRLQHDSSKAYRISRTNIHQSDKSLLNAVNIDLGGAIVRNNTDLTLDGEHIEANLHGFYHMKDSQHVDNHTNINHLKPNCDSNELFKGILEDHSRGVFSGTIYVARDAQKTNAFQSNKNLLLSEEAEIDTKPQLKIFADDVKCSHGATIGELDEESVFYLQQRGISKDDAQVLLRAAFAGEVFTKINLEPVRRKLENLVNQRLQKGQ